MIQKREKLFILLITFLFCIAVLAFFLYRSRVNNKQAVSLSSENRSTTMTGITDGKININAADASLLQALPGIGEVLSARIVEYRTQNGQFHSVEDLMNVKGIGPKLLEKIKPYITTGGTP